MQLFTLHDLLARLVGHPPAGGQAPARVIREAATGGDGDHKAGVGDAQRLRMHRT